MFSNTDKSVHAPGLLAGASCTQDRSGAAGPAPFRTRVPILSALPLMTPPGNSLCVQMEIDPFDLGSSSNQIV